MSQSGERAERKTRQNTPRRLTRYTFANLKLTALIFLCRVVTRELPVIQIVLKVNRNVHLYASG